MMLSDPDVIQLSKIYSLALFGCQRLSSGNFEDLLSELKGAARKFSDFSLEFAIGRLQWFRSNGITSINIGGTMGSGKSEVAGIIAKEIGFTFKDADFFHSGQNIEKMQKGFALTDLDRTKFLSEIALWLTGDYRISSCSALTDLHRAILCGQDVASLVSLKHPAHQDPWNIQTPNFGLLQILIKKSYHETLDELNASSTGNAPRLFNGRPHFVNVSIASENAELTPGAIPLLKSQFELINNSRLMPWDAIVFDAAQMKTSGGYKAEPLLDLLSQLPFHHNVG